ncbi:MAG: thioester reductase, partial [Chloroflexi bacterium]
KDLADAHGEVVAAGRCGLGSVKTNIGHLELAAGVAGVIKVLLQMKHQTLVKSLHSEEINPYIELADSPFYIVQESRPWNTLPDREGRPVPRRAGVSSFGVGGVNAHVVLEEYVAPARRETVARATGPWVIVVSAKTDERLRERVAQLQAALERDGFTDADLSDIAYTLQVGREAMDVRLALMVKGLEELTSRLRRHRDGEAGDGVYRGDVRHAKEALAVLADEDVQQVVAGWIAKGKLSRLAEWWVKGLAVDWSLLYGDERPRRISLPTYPFARERYWVPAGPTERSRAGSGTDAASRLHPLLHRNTSDLDGARFSSTFTGEEYFFRDHVVGGRKVLPAAAQLELARAAVEQAVGGVEDGQRICLEHVVFVRPVVAGEERLALHIALTPEEDGAIAFEIYGEGEEEEAPVYSEGRAILVTPRETPRLDGSAPAQALACIPLPDGVTDAADYVLHPSVVDAALQGVPGLMADEGGEAPALAFALERVEIFGPCRPNMQAHIRHGEASIRWAIRL